MMEFLRSHQSNIMLCLSSACGITAFFAYITTALEKKRKYLIIVLELSATFLLLADRAAYIYRGDVSRVGYFMVRFTNFTVFILTLVVVFMINLYIEEVFSDQYEMDVPLLLRLNEIFFIVGIILVIVSQFTGLYYTFDSYNRYQREPGFIICYLFPLLISVLQLITLYRYRRQIRRLIRLSLFVFLTGMMAVSALQIFAYGLSLNNMAIVCMCILLYVLTYLDLNESIAKAKQIETNTIKKEQNQMHRLFDQTTTAFANAIDARDDETHGHSVRVAEYARKIAMISGMDEEKCEQVYYAGLLHDVGRVAIPESILNKDGDLTEEENDIIRRQPVIGGKILSSIKEVPYLSAGALYHKERYDGGGYPEGLRGEDIPEIARIIAVADAYDTMTSKTGYREPLPQQVVREEIIKGSGSRFDPKYAGIMKQLIDEDSRYQMTGEEAGFDTSWQKEFHCKEYRSGVSYGIPIGRNVIEVTFNSSPDGEFREEYSVPSLILFDALDGHVHDTVRTIRDTQYLEYGEIWFDGHHIYTGARDMHMTFMEEEEAGAGGRYSIEAVKYRDHVRLRLTGAGRRQEIIVALPDSSRAAYLALTGEHCLISDIEIEKREEKAEEGDIPRIADEISYIDRMESDVPNVQIDGYRTASTQSIPVEERMKIRFHAMSLPTANLVWHCPFVVLFHSDDRQMYGENYREFALIRLDGEEQPSDEAADNRLTVEKRESFVGWERWKELNKKGFECTVNIYRSGKKIMTETENFGISISNITTITDGTKDIYAALSGDQCALTDIRILPPLKVEK